MGYALEEAAERLKISPRLLWLAEEGVDYLTMRHYALSFGTVAIWEARASMQRRAVAMNITGGGGTGKRISARRDIALIVAIAVVAAFVCAKLNLSEALLNWTRPLERL